MIAHLADRCDLDLADPYAVRNFLDGDSSHDQANAREHQDSDELRAMLTLLFRLEASSSEDLGIAGLHRLWLQHSEILARFQVRKPLHAGLENGFTLS
ncbi:MAG: hypothetical protein IPP85_14610 [Propionivibrio sp.]|nr:hypothetical protein [Propionivibrio sp.]